MGRSGVSTRARVDKLGVTPGLRVAIVRLRDPTFDAEVGQRTTAVVRGRVRRGDHLVFCLARGARDLDSLARWRELIVPNGAIWVLWPKGRPAFNRDDVFAAAKRAGLVDVKIASFSEELSALKLVIPVADR